MATTTSIQFPRTDRDVAPAQLRLRSDHRAVPSLMTWLAGGLGFFGLMPYLAASVGSHTAVQAGAAVGAMTCAVALFATGASRLLWVYLALMAPLCVSTVWVAVGGHADLGVGINTLCVWALSLTALVATQVLAPACALSLLTGAALATLLHFAVGLWQLVVFPSGQFPLLWLYANPSFLSVQDNAETIARWQRRAFGIFPEPSAMSSSLSPWVLLWTAHLLGLIRFRQAPARWQRTLFALAAVGGMSLIIVSQSGHAAITLVAAGLFVAIWFARARATGGTFAAIFVMFGVVLPAALWMAAASLGKRVGSGSLGNSSWEDRTDSIVIGLRLWLDGTVGTAVLGVGLGNTSPILQRDYGHEAVWSVLLTYLYETGMPGAIAIGCVAVCLVRAWRASSFSVVMASIAFVWLVGVTITTSYKELLSLWMTLGWLAAWPALCVNAGRPVRMIVADRAAPQEPMDVRSLAGSRRWADA